MKIVIDIPEEIKKKRDAGKVLSSMEIAMVCMAIKNGTPLPKGHGDLIDREELKNKYAGWYNLVTDKSIHAVLTSELYQIEPVIPADGGNE